MATLFIHAGQHKTGSSSIQQTLLALRPPHRPHFIQTTRSANLAQDVGGGFRNRRSRPVEPEVRAKMRRRLGLALAEAADRDAVISAEAFETLKPKEFDEFMGLVRHESVRIIAYVREPYGRVSSQMQQRIRGRGGYGELKPIVVNYRSNLEKFERYGLDMVCYDRKSLLNGCAVQDFMTRIGFPIDPAKVVLSNEGLTRAGVALLFMRNRWRQASGLPAASEGALSDVLPKFAGPKFRLHRDLIHRYLQHPRTDIGWAADRFGPDWATPPEPTPDDVSSDSDLLHTTDEAHDWLQAQDPDYVRTDDPAMIGATMERIHARAAAARHARGREAKRSDHHES